MRNLTIFLSAVVIAASIVAHGWLLSKQTVLAVQEQERIMHEQLQRAAPFQPKRG